LPEGTVLRRLAQPGTAPSTLGRLRAALGVLFPEALETAGSGRRIVSVVIQVAAVCAGAVVLLLRIGGIPAWDSVYAEDQGVFLLDALAHPWHLLVPYGGYEELMPRLIGQLVSYLPLVDAAAPFALAGGVIAALCALLIYHALEGWVRSPWMRALAGVALILLPLAPYDIAGNSVNSPWYAMAALPFALLWRPKGWPGMTAAALVAFAATSSEMLAIVCAPLVLLRIIALPRWREQAVTAGWLAGLLVQVPVVLESYAQHTQRIQKLGTPSQIAGYYVHGVLLRALGRQVSLRLTEAVGFNGATVIVCAIVVAGLAWVVIAGNRQVRVFAAFAVLMGLAEVILAEVVAPARIVSTTVIYTGRYTTLPIIALTVTGVVAVDAYLQRQARGGREQGAEDSARMPFIRLTPRGLTALAILLCLLAVGWIPDYRYARGSWGYWKPKAEQLLTACDHSTSGEITTPAWKDKPITIPCDNLRG